MKRDMKMMKNSDKKKKRKLVKDSDETERQKRPKLSVITTSVSWDLRSILSDPDTAFEPLKNFLSLNTYKKVSEADPEDKEEEDEDEEKEEDKKEKVESPSESPTKIFEDACDSFIEESPEFVHLFTLLEKWEKKNSELKMALELFDALLHRLLVKRRKGKEEEEEDEKSKGDDDDDDYESERVQFALRFAAVSKRLLQDQAQVFYKLMDNRNSAAQIKTALKTLTTVTAGGPSGVRLILDHLDLTHPNFPDLLDRRDKRDENDVRLRFILLLVGLLVNGDGKSTERLLETKGFLQNFFSGLLHDSSSTIFLLLGVLKERLLENPAVSKSYKIKIFHEKTLKELAALLGWRPGIEATPRRWNKEAKKQQREREAEATKEEENDEMDEETLQVRTFVADFLKFLLTNAKQGIVFKHEDHLRGDSRHQYRFQTSNALSREDNNPNHLVTVFFKCLHRPFSNGLNRRLALDVLIACPDQIVHFLQLHSHVFVPRPTELWHSATKFLVELVETLPHDDDGAADARVDKGLDEADAECFFDACVPKQFFVGANGISVAGLKHSDLSIVSESLRFLAAVLERANKVISATVASSGSSAASFAASSQRDSLSRAIAKILPPPSNLVSSTSFASGNLALQARQDLPRTLECLDQLIRALSGYSRLTAQAFVEDDCAEVYRVLTMTAFLCGECEQDEQVEKKSPGKTVGVNNGDVEEMDSSEKTEGTVEEGLSVDTTKDSDVKVEGEEQKIEAVADNEEGGKIDRNETEEMQVEMAVNAIQFKDTEQSSELQTVDPEQSSEPQPVDPVRQQLKDILFSLLRLFSINGSLLPQMIKSTSSTGSNSSEASKSILSQFMTSMALSGRSKSSDSELEMETIREFLVQALTSQSYLKEAAVEIGIWFRHLTSVQSAEDNSGNNADSSSSSSSPTNSCGPQSGQDKSEEVTTDTPSLPTSLIDDSSNPPTTATNPQTTTTSPQSIIIQFLDKSLCRLMNHPYPFMDEVMDFQTEAESEGILDLNSDSASESASVASADSIIDAVLSVDPFDENVEGDVLGSSVDEMLEADAQQLPLVGGSADSVEDEMGVDTTLALPFSPIVTAAFAELKHKDFHGKPALDRFMSNVLRDLFHVQADGKALCLFLKKQSKEEETVLNDGAILALVKVYHPHIFSSVETKDDPNGGRLQDLLLSSKPDVDSEISKIADSNYLLQITFQTLFHVIQLVDRVSLTSKSGHLKEGLTDAVQDIAVNWNMKLPRLFKILQSCLRSLTKFASQKQENDLILSRTFEHPTILRWFLRSPDHKSSKLETEESLSYEVTVGVSKCLPLASDLKHVKIGEHLAELSTKAVDAFQTYYEEDASFPSKLFKEALNVVLDNFASHISQSDVANVCRLLSSRSTNEFISFSSSDNQENDYRLRPWDERWDPTDQSVKLSALGKRLFALVETLAGDRDEDVDVSLPPPNLLSSLGELFNCVSDPEDLARVCSAMKSLFKRHPSQSALLRPNTVHKLIKSKDAEGLILEILPHASLIWMGVFLENFINAIEVFKRTARDEDVGLGGVEGPASWMWKILRVYFNTCQPLYELGERWSGSLSNFFLGHLLTSDDNDAREQFPDIGSLVTRDFSDRCTINTLCHTIANASSEDDSEKKWSAQVLFFSAVAQRYAEVEDVIYSAIKLIGPCLKFLLKHLSRGENGKENTMKIFDACSLLLDTIKKGSGVEKAQTLDMTLWSKLVKRTLKTHLKSSASLAFIQRLVDFHVGNDEAANASSAIRPSQLFSMIVSHSEFVEALLNPDDDESKASLLSLIVEIMPLTPDEDFEDESAPKLIKAFTSAYAASLSQSDQHIFAILARFDSSKSGPLKLSLWGKALLEQQSVKQDQEASLWKSEVTMESVLNALDVEMMERTVNGFPVFRMLDPTSQKNYRANGKKKYFSVASYSSSSSSSSSLLQIYDPGFLLPLLLDFLSPSQLFNVKKFVQRRCLAFLFSATSSHFESVRLAAFAALGRFDRHLEGSRFAERNLYQRFLALLKNSIEKPGARLPSIVSAFFARASVILLSPEDEMYCDVCNFILLKPVMDLSQIPEFYRLFNSSNPLKFVKDRLWILELMRDGLVETWDYIIFEKRQAIKTIETLLLCDVAGETSVKMTVISLEILHEAVKIPRACFEIVLDHDFLSTLALLTEKYKNLNVAFKVIVRIFVDAWKTIRTKAAKSKTNVDSVASAYCRAILLCLPHCFDNEDAESLISLLECLAEAVDGIQQECVKESVLTNASLDSLLEFGMLRLKKSQQQQQIERGHLVNAILDVVRLTNCTGDQSLPFVANAWALFIKLWLNCDNWSREEQKRQRESAEKFFRWSNCQLPARDFKATDVTALAGGNRFRHELLRVYEKISSSNFDGRNLQPPCAKALLRFDASRSIGDLLTNLANNLRQ